MTRKRDTEEDAEEPPVGRDVPDTAFPDEGLTANVQKPEDRVRPHAGADDESDDEAA